MRGIDSIPPHEAGDPPLTLQFSKVENFISKKSGTTSPARLQASYNGALNIAVAARELQLSFREKQCELTLQYIQAIASAKNITLQHEVDARDVAEIMLALIDEEKGKYNHKNTAAELSESEEEEDEETPECKEREAESQIEKETVKEKGKGDGKVEVEEEMETQSKKKEQSCSGFSSGENFGNFGAFWNLRRNRK